MSESELQVMSAKVSEELLQLIDAELQAQNDLKSRSALIRKILWKELGEEGGSGFSKQPIDQRVAELHDDVSKLADDVDEMRPVIKNRGMLDERLVRIERRLKYIEEVAGDD